MMAMRTLLIDNYDSYTYNLFQLLAEVAGVEPIVYKHDAISLAGVQALIASGDVHNIVISPGPGSPENPTDIGICLEVLQHLADVPVLGVCLGHQALATAAGARIIRAPEPVHGRVSELHHNGHPLLANIPSGSGQGFQVVRYHSLVVDESSLPDNLQPIAWSHGMHHAVATASSERGPGGSVAAVSGVDSGTGTIEQPPLVMALAHTSQPHYGVQFHPESICTKYGAQLVLNFLQLACKHTSVNLATIPRHLKLADHAPGRAHTPHAWPAQQDPAVSQPLGLQWRTCRHAVVPQDKEAGLKLFEELCAWQPYSFWLDRYICFAASH